MVNATKNAPKSNAKPEKVKLTKEQKAALHEKRKAALKPFRETVDANLLNADGLLTVANIDELGYDPKQYRKITKADFASEPLWLSYRALGVRAHGQSLIEKADEMEREAQNFATFGDPQKRAQVKRIQKIAGALAELRRSLEADGVDVASLLASVSG